MVLTNEHHDISEQLNVNKSPAVAKEKKQLINSEKIRSKLQIKLSSLHELVGKNNMICIRKFTYLQHQLADRDEVIEEMFIKMDTLKKLVTPKRCLKLRRSRNNKKLQLVNEIENILHKSVISSRVTVQPGVKK